MPKSRSAKLLPETKPSVAEQFAGAVQVSAPDVSALTSKVPGCTPVSV